MNKTINFLNKTIRKSKKDLTEKSITDGETLLYILNLDSEYKVNLNYKKNWYERSFFIKK